MASFGACNSSRGRLFVRCGNGGGGGGGESRLGLYAAAA